MTGCGDNWCLRGRIMGGALGRCLEGWHRRKWSSAGSELGARQQDFTQLSLSGLVASRAPSLGGRRADGPALRPRSRRLAVREQREAVGGARGSESVKSGGGGPGKIELGRRWLPPCRKGTLGAQGTVGGGGQVSEVRLHSAWHGTLALGDRVGLQPYTPSGRPQLSSHLLVSPGPAWLGARRRRRSAAGQARPPRRFCGSSPPPCGQLGPSPAAWPAEAPPPGPPRPRSQSRPPPGCSRAATVGVAGRSPPGAPLSEPQPHPGPGHRSRTGR